MGRSGRRSRRSRSPSHRSSGSSDSDERRKKRSRRRDRDTSRNENGGRDVWDSRHGQGHRNEGRNQNNYSTDQHQVPSKHLGKGHDRLAGETEKVTKGMIDNTKARKESHEKNHGNSVIDAKEKRRRNMERLRAWKASQKAPSALSERSNEEKTKEIQPILMKSSKKKPSAFESTDEPTDRVHRTLSSFVNLQESIESEKVINQIEESDEEDPLDAYMKDISPGVAPAELELRSEIPDDNTTSDARQTAQDSYITLEEIMKISQNASEDTNGGVYDSKEDHDALIERIQNQHKEEFRHLEESARVESIEESGDDELRKVNQKEGLGLMHEDDGGHDIVLSEASRGLSAMQMLKETANKKDLKSVDHSIIDYQKFRKNFYVESPQISGMDSHMVQAIRDELEINVRGALPHLNPIKQWSDCGLSEGVMSVLKQRGWNQPFAIQRQAIPIIMSGRDMIGVAKTGSGKTLAFVLPMLRHIADQEPSAFGECEPIALLLAPARELAVQIYDEIRKFSKLLGMRAACCYGGVGIKEQIGSLKRGAEVVVATPGRLIDLLCTNAGRLLGLRRVTYIVLDEADRMFDMGFEPQVMRVIRNTHPEKQIVLFSATFPPQVERLAKMVLKNQPTIVVVGGRTKPSSDIEQFIEVRSPSEKFPRLLQLLGDWYERGNVLVFVKSQETCDKLFEDLIRSGYRCCALHGGMNQDDRDYTIYDFKMKHQTLMVATSVAGRGLDVENLCLVVNYDVPNHLEDYIHRIGRTGRAGRKGTAYTFISPDEEKFSPDLVKALRNANQSIPPELDKMNAAFKAKVESGETKFRNSGFHGSGFTFRAGEKTAAAKQQDLLRKQQEIDLGIREVPENGLVVEDTPDEDASEKVTSTLTPTPTPSETKTAISLPSDSMARVHAVLDKVASSASTATARDQSSALVSREIIINEYPQISRYRVTHQDTLSRINDLTSCSVIPKGVFVQPGRTAPPGERPLYLLVEGASDYDVSRAVYEVGQVLEEGTRVAAKRQESKYRPGRYSVL